MLVINYIGLQSPRKKKMAEFIQKKKTRALFAPFRSTLLPSPKQRVSMWTHAWYGILEPMRRTGVSPQLPFMVNYVQ